MIEIFVSIFTVLNVNIFENFKKFREEFKYSSPIPSSKNVTFYVITTFGRKMYSQYLFSEM